MLFRSVFGGFSAEALSGRIADAQAKVLITADGGWRRGKPADLKAAADEAAAQSPTIQKVLVARRLGDAQQTPMTDGRGNRCSMGGRSLLKGFGGYSPNVV